MERIHYGWLTKSPQQRKTSGPWKLFQARWRRRYFVLYAPPASTMMPGTCSAVLDYYDSDRQVFKKGSIDLTNCIEVKLRPDIDVYKHVFSLRTKHKGRDRTYYLFSDSEDDMKHWVQCLRAVLFLDGTDESGRDTFLHSSSDSASARSVPYERYISFPERGVPSNSSNSSVDTRQPSSPSSPSHSTGSSARCPSPSMAFESQSHDDNSEQYILLEECFSGASTQKSSTSPSVVVPPSHPLSTSAKLPTQSKPGDGRGNAAQSNVNHLLNSVSDLQSQAAANYFNLSDMSNSGDSSGKPATTIQSGHYATVVPYYNNCDDLRLPTKKGGVSTSSSSTDDSSNDSDDSSNSKLPPRVSGRQSNFNSSVEYLEIDHGHSRSADVSGRQSNLESSINYLEIDHVPSADDTGTGKSPGSRSSISGSDYKDIDWIKTKALNDTRKAVENKRKGSEKSTDG